MYLYDEVHDAYIDCVIGNDGKLRETTKLEQMLINWSWMHINKKGAFENIRYAQFEYEPYMEKWFEDARSEFAEYYRKTHHRHTDFEKQIAAAIGIREKRKHVRNTDTGEVFPSMTEACRAYGIDKRDFSKSIRNHWRIGGCHWEYVEEDDSRE